MGMAGSDVTLNSVKKQKDMNGHVQAGDPFSICKKAGTPFYWVWSA